jgi:Zinc-ribbon
MYLQATLRHEELSREKKVLISCIECEQRCYAIFHYLGMECKHCHGFNTVRI